MGYKGVRYEFTMKELSCYLFKKKKCPQCGKRLIKKKFYISRLGSEVNSKSEPVFVGNAKIKCYQYLYFCVNCGAGYSLTDLSEGK